MQSKKAGEAVALGCPCLAFSVLCLSCKMTPRPLGVCIFSEAKYLCWGVEYTPRPNAKNPQSSMMVPCGLPKMHMTSKPPCNWRIIKGLIHNSGGSFLKL